MRFDSGTLQKSTEPCVILQSVCPWYGVIPDHSCGPKVQPGFGRPHSSTQMYLRATGFGNSGVQCAAAFLQAGPSPSEKYPVLLWIHTCTPA